MAKLKDLIIFELLRPKWRIRSVVIGNREQWMIWRDFSTERFDPTATVNEYGPFDKETAMYGCAELNAEAIIDLVQL